tara:strand:- start:3848 stop:4783 length:936 start_codon:yes stop_codon:yes gene_type:complete
MIFDTEKIFKDYPWLKKRKLPMIISANYDGLICASFLHHHLDWDLVGYYNHESLWISDYAIQQKKNIIWVDLNILPKQGKAIGGHIVSVDGFIPKGFETSCNPNNLNQLTSNNFNSKFPFSTLIFLIWLYRINYPRNKMAKLLILNSDATWLKWQRYNQNCLEWILKLPDFNWEELFQEVDSKAFDQQINQLLYPELLSFSSLKVFGKLTSKFLNIKNREFLVNPDWDENLVLNFFQLISKYLLWSCPDLPQISRRIDGIKQKCALSDVKKIGLDHMIDQHNIFSYAITSPRTFSYTTFGSNKKQVIDAKS